MFNKIKLIYIIGLVFTIFFATIVISFFFQSKITDRVILSFKNDINIDLDYSRLEFDFYGNIDIENLLIKDHHNDTIIYGKEIKVLKTSFLSLFRKKISSSQINVKGLEIKVIKYLNESVNSLSRLIDKIKKKNNDFFFLSNYLKVENGFFSFSDQNDKSKKSFIIDSFSFVFDDINFVDKLLNFRIDSLSLSSNLEIINIDYFKSNFDYHPGRISLRNFNYKKKGLELSGKFELNNKNENFKDLFNSSIVKIDISESKIDPSLIELYDIKLKTNQSLTLLLKGEGSINNFRFDKFIINHPLINLNGISTFSFNNDFSIGVGDLIIENLELYSDLIYVEKNDKLNRLINLFGKNIIDGKIKLRDDNFGLVINSKADIGAFNFEGIFPRNFLKNKNSLENIEFKIDFEGLSLNPYFDLEKPFDLFGKINFNLIKEENKLFDLKWKSNNLNIRYGFDNYPNIFLDGYLKDNQILNTLNVTNKILEMKSNFKFDFSDKILKYTAAINLLKFNLNSFGFNFGGGKALLSGVGLIDLRGKDQNSLEGSINLSSLKFMNNNSAINFNPISFDQKITTNKTEIYIKNNDLIRGEILGNYKTREIFSLFQNKINEVYGLPSNKTLNKQSLSFNLKIFSKLIDALYPNISIRSSINLKGNLSSENKKSKFEIQLPLFSYNKMFIRDLNYELEIDSLNKKSLLIINEFKHPVYKIKNIKFSSSSSNDSILIKSNFTGGGDKDIYDLNLFKLIDKKNNSIIGFKKSNIKYRNTVWHLVSNFDYQYISFDKNFKIIKINDLKLKGEDRLISFSALIENKSISELKLNLKNVKLEEVFPIYPSFSFEGKTDLSLNYKNDTKNILLKLNSNVTGFKINGTDLGLLNLSLDRNIGASDYFLKIALLDGKNNNIINGFGKLYDYKMDFYDLNFELRKLNLSFLSRLGKDSINEIEGLASGNFNLIKNKDEVIHKGNLYLTNGQLSIPYLNVKYVIDDSVINLSENNFYFNNLTFIDIKEKSQGLLNGKIYHNNLRFWTFDLNINSNKLLILDKPTNDSELFYGRGFFSGDISLKGLSKNFEINLDGITEKGTIIKIPWTDDYGIEDNAFVSFLDKNTDKKENRNSFFENSIDSRSIEMKFDLDLNELAEIEIVLDKETGSSISGRGNGSFFMEVNTRGKFNIWGDFTALEGIYNFKNLGLIDKKLKLNPGGTIVWDGNPLDAKMDFDAIYEVPGGANPAILLDNPSFNKKIPTEVKIHLEGKLLQPDDPVFEINFPNTSGIVESEINYRLSDPQIRQLQSLSLLSQGIFINEVGVSMQGITNNLYQKASDVFTNLLGENNEKLKVGVNYLQGDKSAILDVATEDRLGFTLSTNISDKILLNGKIGVPIGGLEQTLIVGNIQMDFLLNEEGSLKAKVFSKENEFRYIGDELGYTQGVGISYDVDFSTFKSLIEKILNKESKLKK